MLVTSMDVDPAAFEARTGWALKPQGACKADGCVPLRGNERTDLAALAERLGMAVVHDERAGLWAIGPDPVTGRALASAELPDIVLPDRHGNDVALRSLRGQKVFLLAWASW